MAAETRAAAGAENPYVGPPAVGRGRELYGRDVEARELQNLLLATQTLLLHSVSGAGKTSLIQAKLLDAMATAGIQVIRVRLEAPSASVASGNRYLRALADSLPRGGESTSAAALTEALARGTYSLDAFLLEWRRDQGTSYDRRLLLIFDQFEEIFREPSESAEVDRKRFFRELGEVCRDPHTYTLIAMREEYLGQFEMYGEAFPPRLPRRYQLLPLEAPAAREAIEGPAAERGVKVNEEVRDALVADLLRVKVRTPAKTPIMRLGKFVEPMFLQIACRALWEQWRSRNGALEPDREIGLTDWQKVNVDSALALEYDNAVLKAAREGGKEGHLRDWIQRNLVIGDSRAPVVAGSPALDRVDPEALAVLVESHIVRFESHGDTGWYELVHDRLVSLVTESNQTWFRKYPLIQLALSWELTGAGLLGAPDLAKLAATTHGTELEERFIRESRVAEHRRARSRRWRLASYFVAVAIVVFGVQWLWGQAETWNHWHPLLGQRHDLQNELEVRTFFELREEFHDNREAIWRNPFKVVIPRRLSNQDSVYKAQASEATQRLARARGAADLGRVRVQVRGTELRHEALALLRQRGFTVDTATRSSRPTNPPVVEDSLSRPVNSLVVGDSVSLDLVKEVAYALWATRNPVHRIRYAYRPIPDDEAAAPTNPGPADPSDWLILLSHDDVLREWFPMSVSQLDSLRGDPRRNPSH